MTTKQDELDKIIKYHQNRVGRYYIDWKKLKSQILDWHNKNLLEAIKEHNKFLQKCIEALKVYNQAQEVKNERR